MGIVDFLLRRPSVYKLRRQYDRLRERTDKISDINRRIEILRMLDQIEPSITTLEEHHISQFEKRRIINFVEPNMRKVKFMLDESKKSQTRPEEENYFSKRGQISK